MDQFFVPCTKGQFNTMFLSPSKRGHETWQLVLHSNATVVIHPHVQKPICLWVSDGCWAALDTIEWVLTSEHQFNPALKLELECFLLENRSITFFVTNEVIVGWEAADKKS